MVSHPTSLEVKKRILRLPSDSMRKKSKTPCCPGVRPVMSDVQAGGVSGGTIVRNPARTPSAINALRKGMTPCSMSGSRTENVAPSRPIRRVFTLIGPTSSPAELRRHPRSDVYSQSPPIRRSTHPADHGQGPPEIPQTAYEIGSVPESLCPIPPHPATRAPTP